ncbi:ABC transporter permease [Ignavibacterium sp.]|uniref:ABC transporter permease n=1 Tax=Ignavibacterium sp. TaxID=2651167 RepID=UPI00307DDA7C
MFRKLNIWHLIFSIWLALLIFNFELLLQTVKLFYLSLRLLFSDYNFLSAHFSFHFFDSILSLIVMLVIPILLFSTGIRKKIFRYRLTASNTFIILLTFCFLIPSLITRQHPDFQQNISELKLLPPFSIKYRIELKSANSDSDFSLMEKFIEAKEKVLLKEFDERVYYVKNYSEHQGKYNFTSGSNIISISTDSVKSIKSEIILLGTDEFGRDIFARLIFGARISVFIGIMAVIISLILGLILGFLASTGNPVLSLSLNRLTDLFLSFPSIFLVILILALFGNNLFSVIIVLGFSGWMSLYKIVSSEVATIKGKDYFITAKKIGLTNKELLVREVIPVIIIPVTVNLVFQFSNVILAESALSFLGLGSGNQFPSWGAMIEKGQEYIYEAWWMIFIPGIALVLTLLSIHNIAKELNKFFNPKIG